MDLPLFDVHNKKKLRKNINGGGGKRIIIYHLLYVSFSGQKRQ